MLILGSDEVKYTFYLSFLIIYLIFKSMTSSILGFKKQPPIFRISEKTIIIDEFIDDYRFRHIVEKKINDINSVQYILNSEAPYQYGSINKKSLIRRFFKDDIGDVFIQVIVYFLSFTNLIMSLPIKAFFLFKNREPLSLLFKNYLIEFADGTACIINIYSESNYKKIYYILEKNQIKIDDIVKLSIYLKQEK